MHTIMQRVEGTDLTTDQPKEIGVMYPEKKEVSAVQERLKTIRYAAIQRAKNTNLVASPPEEKKENDPLLEQLKSIRYAAIQRTENAKSSIEQFEKENKNMHSEKNEGCSSSEQLESIRYAAIQRAKTNLATNQSEEKKEVDPSLEGLKIVRYAAIQRAENIKLAIEQPVDDNKNEQPEMKDEKNSELQATMRNAALRLSLYQKMLEETTNPIN